MNKTKKGEEPCFNKLELAFNNNVFHLVGTEL